MCFPLLAIMKKQFIIPIQNIVPSPSNQNMGQNQRIDGVSARPNHVLGPIRRRRGG